MHADGLRTGFWALKFDTFHTTTNARAFCTLPAGQKPTKATARARAEKPYDELQS